jgi:LPS sulfotransferase NodH
VCSTPRSGSGLLCRALAATGKLGLPLEYLNPVLRSTFAERWRCGDGLEDYLEALHSRRTDACGVFGVKVHWAQLEAAAREMGAEPGELLERLAPGGSFVRTHRVDRVAQAVSLWRAERSGVWSLTASEAPDDRPSYDFDGIAACYAEIRRGERAWDELLGEAPTTVEYEALAATYAETVAAVALGLAGTDVDVPPPRSRRLSDSLSAELTARFRADLAARA